MVHYTNFFLKNINKNYKYDNTGKQSRNVDWICYSTLFYEKLGMTALCIMSVLSSVIGTILALNIKIIIQKNA